MSQEQLAALIGNKIIELGYIFLFAYIIRNVREAYLARLEKQPPVSPVFPPRGRRAQDHKDDAPEDPV